MRNLAFLGRNGGEHRHLLRHPLATTVWTHHRALSDITNMKNLGKLFVAILAEKNVLRHGRVVLLDPSSLHT